MAGSSSTVARAARISARMAAWTALRAAGRFSVTVRTPSASATSTNAILAPPRRRTTGGFHYTAAAQISSRRPSPPVRRAALKAFAGFSWTWRRTARTVSRRVSAGPGRPIVRREGNGAETRRSRSVRRPRRRRRTASLCPMGGIGRMGVIVGRRPARRRGSGREGPAGLRILSRACPKSRIRPRSPQTPERESIFCAGARTRRCGEASDDPATRNAGAAA